MEATNEFFIVEYDAENPTNIILEESSKPLKDVETCAGKERNDYKWSVNGTKMLIDLYKKYRTKVGSFKLRTVKYMWQRIAKELSDQLQANISPSNCENRWRVLDRNYKKYVDNQKSTGRGKRYFEYAEEMEDLFGKKKAVHPELLLNSDSQHIPSTGKENIPSTSSAFMHKEMGENCINVTLENPNVPKIGTRKPRVTKHKKTLLESFREERLNYQEKRLQIEQLKLDELKKRNILIQERNSILKELKCCCHCKLPN